MEMQLLVRNAYNPPMAGHRKTAVDESMKKWWKKKDNKELQQNEGDRKKVNKWIKKKESKLAKTTDDEKVSECVVKDGFGGCMIELTLRGGGWCSHSFGVRPLRDTPTFYLHLAKRQPLCGVCQVKNSEKPYDVL